MSRRDSSWAGIVEGLSLAVGQDTPIGRLLSSIGPGVAPPTDEEVRQALGMLGEPVGPKKTQRGGMKRSAERPKDK